MKHVMIAAVVCLLVTTSCNNVAGWFGSGSDSTANADSNYTAWERDESINESNAYSDLFLDSADIENYIQQEKLDDSVARDIRNFYMVRNYQYAWFTTQGLTEQGRGLWSLHSSDSADVANHLKGRMDSLMMNDSLVINSDGYSTSSSPAVNHRTDTSRTSGTSGSAASQTAGTQRTNPDSAVSNNTNPGASSGYISDSSFVRTELGLTKEFIEYAKENQGFISASQLYFLVPSKRLDALALADSILNKNPDSARHSANPAYTAMKQHLSVYYNAEKNGGWQPISGASGVRQGSSSPVVSAIKKRLAATNDYTSADTTAQFSDSLSAAIKDFQLRHGLAATGQVNDSLIAELNVPARERLEQILVNMNRTMWMKPMDESNRIVVNIPSYMLYVIEGNTRAMEMPVIVGKQGAGTVMFSGDINQVVFSPAWNVPQSIVQNEIMPAMKKDKSYLKKKNMEIVNQNDSIPQIRQLPGKDNAMGRVKFLFPNSYDIYLHDTPDKSLFNKKDRALSHGCIRVQNPEALAEYVLKNQGEWTPEKIRTAMNGNNEQHVKVSREVPVYITYYTTWVDENGKLNFRNDVYGHDKKTMSRMFLRS